MTAATKRKPAQVSDEQKAAALAAAPGAETMTADQILAELTALDGPLTEQEAVVEAMREKRLALWCAARLLPKDDRPIFVAIAEASHRSEALVVKQTQNAFKRHGITPPR